jgi:hypothetical protein
MSHDHALVTSRLRARDQVNARADPPCTPPNERSSIRSWPAFPPVERERTRGRRPPD